MPSAPRWPRWGRPGGPGRAVAAALQPGPPPSPVSAEEAKTRIQTYLSVAQKGDPRSLPFLRTAWRSERDPAVRAVLADSIYQSDPRDYLGSRALLDSFTASDEVYGRLPPLSRDLKVEVPCVGSLTALAAEGNGEALARLIELARASSADDAPAQTTVATSLADVAKTAPDELLVSLRAAPAKDRDAALVLLARGVAQQQDPDHPLWPAVRKVMASTDPATAAYGTFAGHHALAANGSGEGPAGPASPGTGAAAVGSIRPPFPAPSSAPAAETVPPRALRRRPRRPPCTGLRRCPPRATERSRHPCTGDRGLETRNPSKLRGSRHLQRCSPNFMERSCTFVCLPLARQVFPRAPFAAERTNVPARRHHEPRCQVRAGSCPLRDPVPAAAAAG